MAMAVARAPGPRRVLPLLLLLVATGAAVAASENRPIEQYEHSGYFWPQTILWRDTRISPGVLWFAFFSFAVVAVLPLLLALMGVTYMGNATSILTELVDDCNRIMLKLHAATAAHGLAGAGSPPPPVSTLADLHDYVDAFIQSILGAALLYVSLAVTRLSDALEACLVGLCSIQLLLDSRRTRKAGSPFRD